jgi:hypothetical protein
VILINYAEVLLKIVGNIFFPATKYNLHGIDALTKSEIHAIVTNPSDLQPVIGRLKFSKSSFVDQISTQITETDLNITNYP